MDAVTKELLIALFLVNVITVYADVAQDNCHATTVSRRSAARMRTFFSLRVTFRTLHPMHMHWLKMFERFCVSLQNHSIRAPRNSWVFLSSLLSLLSCLRLRRRRHR